MYEKCTDDTFYWLFNNRNNYITNSISTLFFSCGIILYTLSLNCALLFVMSRKPIFIMFILIMTLQTPVVGSAWRLIRILRFKSVSSPISTGGLKYKDLILRYYLCKKAFITVKYVTIFMIYITCFVKQAQQKNCNDLKKGIETVNKKLLNISQKAGKIFYSTISDFLK